MDIDYGKIHRQAARYAARHGRPNDAEDFAQECCLYAFKNKSDKLFLQRRFSDYLRRNYGRKGTPGGDARWAFARASEVYDDEAHGFDLSFELFAGGDPSRIGSCLSLLSRYERLIYVLHHKYEVPLTQIADSQGVSESRISQVLKRIQEAVYKEVTRAESGISRNGKAEVERILRTQGERLECEEGGQVAEFESFALESFDATGL